MRLCKWNRTYNHQVLIATAPIKWCMITLLVNTVVCRLPIIFVCVNNMTALAAEAYGHSADGATELLLKFIHSALNQLMSRFYGQASIHSPIYALASIFICAAMKIENETIFMRKVYFPFCAKHFPFNKIKNNNKNCILSLPLSALKRRR